MILAGPTSQAALFRDFRIWQGGSTRWSQRRSNATINNARTSSDALGRPEASHRSNPMIDLSIKVKIDLRQVNKLLLAIWLILTH